ncbi:MAG: hypothetical protein AABY03_00750 [Nanoarchaeota archaeon]
MLRSSENTIGAWAFLIGVILAILIGLSTTFLPIPALVNYSKHIYAFLVFLGILVGFMNTTGKDSQTFLIAGAVLVIVSRFGMDSLSGSVIGLDLRDAVTSVFSALLVLFAPATIIVAMKTVFSIARV